MLLRTARLPRLTIDAHDHVRNDHGHAAAKITVRPPRLLEENVKISEFKRWEISWENYAKMTKLYDKDQEEQIGALRNNCSDNFIQKMIHDPS